MGFECPNYSEGRCYRQEDGSCAPTQGNCILKGKYRTFWSDDKTPEVIPEPPDSANPTGKTNDEPYI